MCHLHKHTEVRDKQGDKQMGRKMGQQTGWQLESGPQRISLLTQVIQTSACFEFFLDVPGLNKVTDTKKKEKEEFVFSYLILLLL